MDAVDPSAFTGALSAAANSVSIVTTSHEGTRRGLTVSSMCSVCADPPLLLACVNTDSDFCELADASGYFAVNMLEHAQVDTALVFAGIKTDNTTDDRFEAAGEWTALTTGSPILTNALVSLDCAIDSSFTRGTHRVFIGKVVGIAVASGSPLVYANREFVRPHSPT